MSASLSALFLNVRNGAPNARNELLAGLQQNLQRLTAAILSRHFPLVAKRREVDSVLGDLNCALLKATDAGFTPGTVNELVTYAARCLRNLLIDEAEKIRRRHDFAPQPDPDQSAAGDAHAPPAADDSVSMLPQWVEFQKRLAELPDDERVVFDMHFHMKVPQSEIAEVLGKDPKVVSRLWLGAAYKLKDVIPKLDGPKRVLLIAGGQAFAHPDAKALFAKYRAFQVTACGGADGGKLPGREAFDRADVVMVTRPEYAALVRAKAAAHLGAKPLACLDLPDAFDAADTADVNALWGKLTRHLGA